MTDDERDWIFTFGHGQANFGKFVRIHGTYDMARATMIRHFGRCWSMQYGSEKEAEVSLWRYTELVLPGISNGQ